MVILRYYLFLIYIVFLFGKIIILEVGLVGFGDLIVVMLLFGIGVEVGVDVVFV